MRPTSTFSKRRLHWNWKWKWKNAFATSKPAKKTKWPHNSNVNSTSEKRSCATKRSSMFASVRRKSALKSRLNWASSVLKSATVSRASPRKWTPSRKWLKKRCENLLLSKSKAKLTWMKRNSGLESVSSVPFNQRTHVQKSVRSGCNQFPDRHQRLMAQAPWTRVHSVLDPMGWGLLQAARYAVLWVSKTSLSNVLASETCVPQ